MMVLSAKEKIERAVTDIDKKLAKRAAGERSLSVGELICTGIGVAVIAYALFKLEGDKKKGAIAAALGLIFVGEIIW